MFCACFTMFKSLPHSSVWHAEPLRRHADTAPPVLAQVRLAEVMRQTGLQEEDNAALLGLRSQARGSSPRRP